MKKANASCAQTASVPRGSSANVTRLAKSGVLVEYDRLSEAELSVIDSLSDEEVAALVSVHEKSSNAPRVNGPFWCAFCF